MAYTSLPLTGRIAMITGASSGIGAATARRLAAQGAQVALAARRTDRLQNLADEIGESAVPFECDITRTGAVHDLAERVSTALGEPDVLVNNAAVMLPNPLADARIDEWQRMIALNVTALLEVTAAFLPHLSKAIERGRPADIVNVSSTGADVQVPSFAVYGSTKAAMSYLSRSLRVELAPQGLRITDIKPGGTDTELFQHGSHSGIRERLIGAAQQMRLLDPEDVADAISYAITRPAHVCLSQMTVMPLTQAQ
ncbi:SDR family oxidoreductase [Actinocorallia sp. B10E7]|uniref:SDR family oxidoreductase n=1 Tax=Actinocorallia sp. B10E7 TaxID=3153558 RepID=UPI00325D31B7